MEDIRESMTKMTQMFTVRLAEFEERQLKIIPSSPDASNLAQEFSTFKAFTMDALRLLQNQVELLARQNDTLEMHSRRKILLFHGVPEDKKEDVAGVIAKMVVQRLKMPEFKVEDVSRCHRVGRVSVPDKPRPILIKVHDISMRGKLWAAKTNLKGSGITMSEFLTKSRHDTFMAARQRYGVKNSWTREGVIYVLTADGSRHRVNGIAELDRLGDKAASTVAAPKQAVAAKETTVAAKRRAVNAAKK